MFSWEAFATLTTGVLAVGVAAWVGFNQVKLQRRQTKLIENDLKIQLLEKRSKCVESMRKISSAWIAHMKLTDEEWLNFHALFREAELLFPPDVTKNLDQALSGIFWAKQHFKRSSQYYERGDTKQAEHRMDDAFAEEDKVMKIMPTLLNELIDHTRIDAWE